MTESINKLLAFAALMLAMNVAALETPAQEASHPAVDRCHRLAGNEWDEARPDGYPAVELDRINHEAAIEACREAVKVQPDDATLEYQFGRALEAADRQEAALVWFRKAEEKGYAAAMHTLGAKYFNGQGVEKDYDTAYRLFGRAAKSNFVPSFYALGAMNARGSVGSRDHEAAAEWYGKAAARGYARAQAMLGELHRYGAGVPKDYEKAAELYRKAIVNGYEDAQEYLDKLPAKYRQE